MVSQEGLVINTCLLFRSDLTAFIQNKSLEKYNLALQNQNQKLNRDGVLLQTIKNDSIELTKQSISDVKKKFPDLIVTLNCKALD